MKSRIAVVTAAVASLVVAPAAFAQGVTNPADNPFPISVTIDGQTYTDGRDTLPGYDDQACTPIPYVSYDFGQNQVLYYDADGQLLKSAKWTEWSRITSYQAWVDDQKKPTPTATPAATNQATATPTVSAGGGGTTTAPASNSPAATNQTSAAAPTTTTKRPSTKTQTTKSASSGTTQRSGGSTSKGQSTKSSTTTKASSTTSPTTTTTSASSPASSSASSSSPSASAPSASSSTSTAPEGGADASVDAAATTTAVDGAVPVADAGTGEVVPGQPTEVAANGTVVPAGATEPGPGPVAAVADTTKYQLASQAVGNVEDTRLAGIGILVALVAAGFFCLAFGEFRQQLFGRYRRR